VPTSTTTTTTTTTTKTKTTTTIGKNKNKENLQPKPLLHTSPACSIGLAYTYPHWLDARPCISRGEHAAVTSKQA
jgi:hypothetical protein